MHSLSVPGVIQICVCVSTFQEIQSKHIHIKVIEMIYLKKEWLCDEPGKWKK